jgi:N utilization substance protein B
VEKNLINGKRKARKLALQALYQWLMSGTDLHEIEAQFRTINNMSKVDVEYFCELLHGVVQHAEKLDTSYLNFLDREAEALNPIELTVIRLGAYELLYRPEVPFKVVLDEAITLTKEFGSQDGHRYVNGVLNNLARDVRQVEVKGTL